MTDCYWLSDRQFERMATHLPQDTRGVARVDDRRVISGIIHVLQSGCRWKDAPKCYGPHKTLYNRFVRWAEKGIWEKLFHHLAEAGGPPAALMIDATHIKAHRSAAGGKGGLKRRRLAVRAAAELRKSMPLSTSKAARGN
jgi:transposase